MIWAVKGRKSDIHDTYFFINNSVNDSVKWGKREERQRANKKKRSKMSRGRQKKVGGKG